MEGRYIPQQYQEGHCPLDNGRHDFSPQPDSPGLGRLPMELIEIILKHLDIPSLTTFRRVSKRAMDTVDKTFEYKEVLNRAPQMIRCALALGARGYTLHDAYVTLKQKPEPCCPSAMGSDRICMIRCERVCTCGRTRPAPAAITDKGLAARFLGPWYSSDDITTKITAVVGRGNAGFTLTAESYRYIDGATPEGYGKHPAVLGGKQEQPSRLQPVQVEPAMPHIVRRAQVFVRFRAPLAKH